MLTLGSNGVCMRARIVIKIIFSFLAAGTLYVSKTARCLDQLAGYGRVFKITKKWYLGRVLMTFYLRGTFTLLARLLQCRCP